MKHKGKEKAKEDKEPGQKDSRVEELESRIEALQEEKDELFSKLQRVSADYANFQKRSVRQVADTVAYEKENMMRTLLPALDNFEHTLQSADSADSVDVLGKGVRIVYDQIVEILKSHGVEEIQALGRKFDPSFHEAMMRRAEPDRQEDIILEEFQKGYKLNGRVIRPSKVVVNKLGAEEPAQKQPENQQEPVEDDCPQAEQQIQPEAE